jgi:DNA invertase Pin-like site-specific DNA recombinase
MNATNGTIDLGGNGAAYVRISDTAQETVRQYEAIRAFEARHGVRIAESHWFEDEGWARDEADRRPDFNRLLKLAESGSIRWIVVSERDRFGTADADEFIAYRYQLRKWGCKLYDAAGTDWTRKDISTVIISVVDGDKSEKEQMSISKRSLGGKLAGAKAGEWQGGPIRLGFDVACYDRGTGTELFRVVYQGRDWVTTTTTKGVAKKVSNVLRLKVYPDGRSERFDGRVVFRTNTDTQVLRLVPTRDEAKLAAVRGIFRRYSSEAVSFRGLAIWLNDLGITNSFGQPFQSRDIAPLLRDETYLGYPTFFKQRAGKFHRVANGTVEVLPAELRRTYTTYDTADTIRSTRPDGQRWFEPLVDRQTWDACQKKLGNRQKAPTVPRSSGLYLSGLLRCAGCGQPMFARKDRREYYCATYHRFRCAGNQAASPCLRNGVAHSVLEGYVDRFLDEAGKRLELLTSPPSASDHLTDRLSEQEETAWSGFFDGLTRLTAYLAEHCTDQYNDILGTYTNGDEFMHACIATYREHFDSDKVASAIAQAEAELQTLMDGWADLPRIPLVQAKAQERMAAAASRVEELRQQQTDAADVVNKYRMEISDLQVAIAEAMTALRSESGVQAQRRRAEALRSLLVEIRCQFVVTGKGMTKHVGPGQARSRLAAVTFLPIAGDGQRFLIVDGSNTDTTPTISATPSC